MRHSIKTGLSFGLTSGVITTLGLITGLNASTGSKSVVIGGILVIAIADAMSDALGIHMSEESENIHTVREIWESTAATFLSKFIFTLTFVIPVLLMELPLSIMVCVVWGLFLIALYNYYIAKAQKIKALPMIMEHVFIVILVIITTQLIGNWVATLS